MQWLARLCVRQPVLTWVMTLAILVVGIVCYGSLGLDRAARHGQILRRERALHVDRGQP